MSRFDTISVPRWKAQLEACRRIQPCHSQKSWSGGRGWSERSRTKPRGFGLRPPTPPTPRLSCGKARGLRDAPWFAFRGQALSVTFRVRKAKCMAPWVNESHGEAA